MKKKPSSFAVIMSCYDCERQINRAIKALISNKLFEQILIFEDYSNDNTKKILKGFEGVDPRLSIFFSNKNIGTVNAINSLISQLETDYVLFASCNDQISSLLVKEAQKDIDKFGACGLWSGKAKYLNEDIFDKYYLPMIASHKSLKVKNPYDYFCKMGGKFEGSTAFFNVEIVRKYYLKSELQGLADCILGIICSLEKGLIINKNILSKVSKNNLYQGYLANTYKNKEMDFILKIFKKELINYNNFLFKNNNYLLKVISAQIIYGYLKRSYIKKSQIPNKYDFVISIIRIFIYRLIYFLKF